VSLVAERKRDETESRISAGSGKASTTDKVVDPLHQVPDLKFDVYVEAVNKVKKLLKTTSETPTTNSVLNSLRFYTREEHLDEYFCTTCNEGFCYHIPNKGSTFVLMITITFDFVKYKPFVIFVCK